MTPGREIKVLGLLAILLAAGCSGGPECRVDTDCPGNQFCLDDICQVLPIDDGNPCDGVVCDRPPDDTCQNPNTLLWYESLGVCSQGECSYLFRPVICEQGCQQGDCQGCLADCDGRECGDDGCGGSCGDCPAGETCQSGECQEQVADPCDGVFCDHPPERICVWETVLRIYKSPGECHQGECSYAYAEEHCPNGCDDGACQECQPQCEGRQCGPDGCGGTCAPGCSDWELCEDGACFGLESCNGEDDDADGVCDNGFACCLGASEPCQTECGTQGTGTCITGCSWRCDPPVETCNGVDDDCNGLVDELDECGPCGTLQPGNSIASGSSLHSCEGRARLAHQADGNLVLVQNTGAVLWNTQTWGNQTDRLSMQTDGNLVLYSTGGSAVWYSSTWDHPGAFLSVQDDCNMVIYAGSTPVWWTGTACQ